MGSLGERLKRTRENRKITLEQVATATKISTRLLKALEEEKFDQLPGGIFNKGFVRSYARFLGVDEAQAIRDYVEASGEAKQPPAAEDAELKAIADRKQKERERQRAQSKGVPWGLTAAVLLLAALTMAVWGFYSRERQDATRQHRNPPVAKTTAPAEHTAAVPSSQPTLTDISQSSDASQPSVAPASTTSAVADSFTVSVQANQDSWLTVTADGRQVFSDMLVAPAARSFQAQNQMQVRAGNAGGLEISFNGKKLSPAGDDGEVKTLTFGPSGLEVSSPKAE